MKEFKLNVGDKVFIREDLENGTWYGGDTWTNSMISGEHTVKAIINQGRRFSVSEYDEDDPSVIFYYTPEMIDWDKTRELNKKGNEVKEEKQTFKDLVELCRIAYYENKVIGGIGTAKSFVDDEDAISVIALDGSSLFTISNFSTQNEIEECISILKDQYPPKQTFDDLIDVVVQAKKDKVITNVEIYNNGICATYLEDVLEIASDEEIASAIDKIKSLYTETFVIDSEEDIRRTKVGANVEMLNGNKDIVLYKSTYMGNEMIQFSDNKHWGALGLFILKGATVTQKVGK